MPLDVPGRWVITRVADHSEQKCAKARIYELMAGLGEAWLAQALTTTKLSVMTCTVPRWQDEAHVSSAARIAAASAWPEETDLTELLGVTSSGVRGVWPEPPTLMPGGRAENSHAGGVAGVSGSDIQAPRPKPLASEWIRTPGAEGPENSPLIRLPHVRGEELFSRLRHKSAHH